MRNKNLTEIICLIDQSYSMDPLISETIQGFNTFVDAQKKLAGRVRLTVVLFDTQYACIADAVDIEQFQQLNESIYVPTRQTALFDAIGRTLDELGHRLENISSKVQPDAVIVAILTDGEDNASFVYSMADIFDRIRFRQDACGWKFVFLAANQDVMASAMKIGIDSGFVREVEATSKGILESYGVINEIVTRIRMLETEQIMGKV